MEPYDVQSYVVRVVQSCVLQSYVVVPCVVQPYDA